MTNRRKNSIDLSDIIHNIRKNSIDSIDSRSYSTDENTPRTPITPRTPRTPCRNNSIEIKIDISNNETNSNMTNKISIPKKRRQRDQELYNPKSPPTIEYLKQVLLIYKQE